MNQREGSTQKSPLIAEPSHPRWVSLLAILPLGCGALMIIASPFLLLVTFLNISQRERTFGDVDAAIVLGGKVVVGFLIVVGSYTLIQLGVKTLNLGRRLLAVDDEYRALQDPRQRVLYLRSFGHDRQTAASIEGFHLPNEIRRFPFQFHWLPEFDYITEEEALASVLTRIGATIAVGAPNERLPRIGMPRVYIETDAWQDSVQSLLSEAALVVIRAGLTRGLWEEIELAAKSVRPERLVFVIPFGTNYKQCDEFRKRINSLLPREIPLPYGTAVPGLSITNLLYFRPDWTPCMISLDDIVKGDRGKSLKTSKLFLNAFGPVLDQLSQRKIAPLQPNSARRISSLI